MLEFKRMQLSDINHIRPYFNYSVNRTCDNSAGGAFMWRNYFSVEYAEYNETIVFKTRVVYSDNLSAFTIPLGKDILGCISKIVEYCNANNLRISFCTVTKDEVDMLETIFNDFQLFKETNWSDYVYLAESLRTLSGRKYNGQRNHMNYFKRTFPNHSFEVITNENLAQVRDFYVALSKKVHFDTDIAEHEHDCVLEVLDNYDLYGQFGGLLKVDGHVVAFSVAENINDVMFVHIEKADIAYRGAYQVINNELVKHFASDEIKYVNREEDVGDEGLRYSKRSYHPHEIIDKFIFLVDC